jgi:hypothetical protein
MEKKLVNSVLLAVLLIAFAVSVPAMDNVKDEGIFLRYDFSRAEGGVVKDLSPLGHNGKLEKGTAIGDDEFGKVLELDGKSGFVTVPGLSVLRIKKGLTVSAVLRFDDVGPAPGCADMIAWKKDCFLFGRDPNGKLYFNIYSDKERWNKNSINSAIKVPTNEYVHVAVTAEYVDEAGFTGYRCVLWLNGMPIGDRQLKDVVFAENDNPVEIGTGFGGGPWFFKGRMAIVGLYGLALKEEELVAEGESSKYVKGIKKRPVVQFRLNAITTFGCAEGDTVKDPSPLYASRVEGWPSGANIVDDEFGKVLELDGKSGFVTVPGLSGLRIKKGLSISAVLRFDDIGPAPGCADMIAWKKDCFLFGRDPNGKLYFNIKSGTGPNYNIGWNNSLNSAVKVPTKEFVHVAVTAEFVCDAWQGFTGYKCVLWLNGNPIGDARFNNVVFPENDNPVDIANGFGGGPWFFTGRMVSVSLYDRALTEGEIVAETEASPYVKGIKKSLSIAPAVQVRLNALTARLASPEAAWIAGIIGRLARDGRFAALAEPSLEKVDALLAAKPVEVLAWWQDNGGTGIRIIKGEQMHVALAVTGDRCELAGVYDAVAGKELLGDLISLWSLKALTADKKDLVVESSSVPSALAAEPVRDGGAVRFALAWKHVATTAEPVAFTVRSQMTLEGRRLSMNLTVDNQSPDIVLSEVVFPATSFQRLTNGTDTFIDPYFYGEARSDCVRNNSSYSGLYPSAHATMQFGAYYDEERGVYFAAEDPQAQSKHFVIQGKRGQLIQSWRWYVGNPGRGGNGFCSSGQAVIEAFNGDWFDAGQIYKRWLESGVPWFLKLGRPDTPQWYKDCTVGVIGYDQFLSDFRAYLGQPFTFDDGSWAKDGKGTSVPGGYPRAVAKAEYKDQVASRLREGIVLKPYMNYRLWSDTDEKWSSIGLPSAVKTSKGEIASKEDYRPSGGNIETVMCPAAAAYQAEIGALFEHIVVQGVNAIYIDQMGAGRPVLCFDPTHGHSLGGGGNWMKDGYWKYFGEIRRKLKAANPNLVFETEDMAEPVAGLVDGYLTYRSFTASPGVARLPLFPSIYAGHVQFYGKGYYENDRKAFYAMTGEALVNGEHFGYIWPNKILMSEHRKAFFKRVVLTRQCLLPFMNDGAMAHPLKFQDMPIVVSNWGEFGSPAGNKSPAIEHSVWKRPEGIAMVFVNVTDKEVSTGVDFDGSRRRLAGEKLTLRKCDGSAAAPLPVGNRFKLSLRLPPYTSEIWVVTPTDGAKVPEAVERIVKGMAAVRALAMPSETQVPQSDGPVKARFLRVEASYDSISMAEFEAMSSGVNVALNKVATQSSVNPTWIYSVAKCAVDGNPDPKQKKDTGNSVSNTASRQEEWWEVDLGVPVALDSIKISGFTSVGPNREKWVKALDEQRKVVWQTELCEAKPVHEMILKGNK